MSQLEHQALDEPATVMRPCGLMRKLAEVMGAIERVPKSGWNDFHRYAYATEADIADTLRGELAGRGVMLLPRYRDYDRLEFRQTRAGAEQWLHTVILDLEFVDSETGETYVSPDWLGLGIDGEDKGYYKAMTGAMKYALMKTFQVSTGDDPEAAPSHQAPAAPAAASRPQPLDRSQQRQSEDLDLTDAMIRKLHAAMKDAGGDHSELSRVISWKTSGQARSVTELKRRHMEPLLGAIASYGMYPENARETLNAYFVEHPENDPDEDATGTIAATVAAQKQAATLAAQADAEPRPVQGPLDPPPRKRAASRKPKADSEPSSDADRLAEWRRIVTSMNLDPRAELANLLFRSGLAAKDYGTNVERIADAIMTHVDEPPSRKTLADLVGHLEAVDLGVEPPVGAEQDDVE